MNRTPVESKLLAAVGKERLFTVAERLAVALTVLEAPKSAVARLSKATGLHRPGIYGYLKGAGSPRLESCLRMSKVLGVNPGWLAFGIPPVLAKDVPVDNLDPV